VSPLHVDSKEFPLPTRVKGEHYYREGRVALERVGDEYIEATVDGTEPYRVRLIRDLDDLVDHRCTCPAHERHGECKHVWATIVAVRRCEEEEARAREEERRSRHAERIAEIATRIDRDLRPEAGPAARSSSPERSPPGWREQLERAESSAGDARESRWPRNITGEIQLLYWLSRSGPARASEPRIAVVERKRSMNGWSEPHPFDPRGRALPRIVGGEDLRLLALLRPFHRSSAPSHHGRQGGAEPYRSTLPGPLGAWVLRELAAAGRLLPEGELPEESAALRFEEEPWEFSFAFVPSRPEPAAREGSGTTSRGDRPRRAPTPFRESSVLRGWFARGDRELPLEAVRQVIPAGFVVEGDRIAPFAPAGALRWIEFLEDPLSVPDAEVAECAARILAADPRAPLVLPVAPRAEVIERPPAPRLVVRAEAPRRGRSRTLSCRLLFDYGHGVVVSADDTADAILAGDAFIFRDRTSERARVAELLAAGVRRSPTDESLERTTVAAVRLPALIERLLELGWSVEADGRVHRAARAFDLRARSGIDWLDLEGTVTFDGVSIAFPRLLGALRRGERLIALDDGSFGVLPARWLARSGVLASLGELDGDSVRFRPGQAWLLDALLAELPEFHPDEAFAALAARIRAFTGIAPRHEPASFRGELRPYQREGLAWLEFLRELSLGGCLADDMGLGKTVQVIAHLEELRAAGRLDAPALVVAPRSVLENWLREIARFAPALVVVDASGPDRAAALPELGDAHVVLTTYAILRRDIPALRERRFDTVVFDEAQAIKNARSQTAKAARLLRADHRLALSGTPIENHLGELWSLFEFLQPGMLGLSSRFSALLGEEDPPGAASAGSATDEGRLAPLARAVRPFILRRTKSQVATDLPERTEQTIDCPLAPGQQELYDELLAHYRAALLPGIHEHGTGRMAIRVIEALLRLRQAACHPGLLDPERREEPSGKLEVLLDRIEELRDEGHRCLVFSQFTSFLAIVRSRLDARGIAYEYLDGRTRDRQPRIDRFQLEGKGTAFLISLKAGGLGLNLTAADYVFLLDPWWNPATEAQAIDRAHRIGQTAHVFAYRLIAPGTVEEKIVELQASKRGLADAIIRADEGLVANLTAEDLELLLAPR